MTVTETNNDTGAGFGLAHVARGGPPPSTLMEVANAFTHSNEYYSSVITAAYQQYLGAGRTPPDWLTGSPSCETA